jgi:hypothetical protein
MGIRYMEAPRELCALWIPSRLVVPAHLRLLPAGGVLDQVTNGRTYLEMRRGGRFKEDVDDSETQSVAEGQS